MGFAPSKSDSSLFVQTSQTRPISILLYVKDLVIVGADLGEIRRVKSQLVASFDMKDLWDLHYFLGIEVIRTPKGILISQRHYALSMLFKFGMAECKCISTPLDRNVKLRPDSGQACDATLFRQIVGSLIYLTITHPDLSYPLGLINQYMSQPKAEHLQCAQRILHYVSGTKDRALLYQTGIVEQLVGYTDVDWDGNVGDRKLAFRFPFSLGSAAIACNSKKQPTVALSSTEARYRGAVVATCESIWMKRLLKHL